MIKVIKTEADYNAALARIEELILRSKSRTQDETNELEVLTLLVQKYEQEFFPTEIPDPVDAIQFRMEQQDLQPRDLIPYLGSRSKVSEVLSGKRPLTLSMIRALNEGLGIPLKALVKEPTPTVMGENEIEWGRFPIREMINRGWIDEMTMINPENVLRSFFAPLGGPKAITALYRKTQHTRSGRRNDPYALDAWRARVMLRALENPPTTAFLADRINEDFIKEVVRLSVQYNGPSVTKDFLYEHGISLIIEPQLPETYLDGAALKTSDSHPVIGMTLRFDRLDNFWFVLVHELIHVVYHLTSDNEFYDDLEAADQGDLREIEADKKASEILIPEKIWLESRARATKSPEAVMRLADNLGIHHAIIAGRIRHRENNYRLLNQLVGHNEVRRWFPDVNWDQNK